MTIFERNKLISKALFNEKCSGEWNKYPEYRPKYDGNFLVVIDGTVHIALFNLDEREWFTARGVTEWRELTNGAEDVIESLGDAVLAMVSDGVVPKSELNHEGDEAYRCGNCYQQLHFIAAKYQYCPSCGTKIKW